MNFGLRKFDEPVYVGTCESDYWFGYSCGISVDNCVAGFIPSPWYSKKSSGCKCWCSDRPLAVREKMIKILSKTR